MATQPKPELLTQEWREEHCLEGDETLRVAHDLLEDSNYATTDINVWGLVSTLAVIAQAHYAAANVRAKPSAQPVPRHAGADGWCPDYGSRVDPCPPGCASGTCVYGGDKVGS